MLRVGHTGSNPIHHYLHTGPPAVCILVQQIYWGRSLYCFEHCPLLSHLRMLFIDYSSAINTVIPAKLTQKLFSLGLNHQLCEWNLDFPICQPQSVRIGISTSRTLLLNTGTPQGCVLSPILYTLYTHHCAASHANTAILRFADRTTVLGLISNNDESAYRREVEDLLLGCQNNNLTLNVIKTKEVIVDLRKGRSQHTPLHIGETEVERVDNFKFLSFHIREDFTWTQHITHQQRANTCREWSESTQYITGTNLSSNPSLQDIYQQRVLRRARNTLRDPTHPQHHLFTLLASGRRYRSVKCRTSRIKDSFYPQAIRMTNISKPLPSFHLWYPPLELCLCVDDTTGAVWKYFMFFFCSLFTSEESVPSYFTLIQFGCNTVYPWAFFGLKHFTHPLHQHSGE